MTSSHLIPQQLQHCVIRRSGFGDIVLLSELSVKVLQSYSAFLPRVREGLQAVIDSSGLTNTLSFKLKQTKEQH